MRQSGQEPLNQICGNLNGRLVSENRGEHNSVKTEMTDQTDHRFIKYIGRFWFQALPTRPEPTE